MKTFKFFVFLAGAFLISTQGYVTRGYAADLQEVATLASQISAKLTQIQTADFIEYKPLDHGETQPHEIRHTYMLSRKNHQLIGILRKINGLEDSTLPQMDLKNWNEADIVSSLKAQLKDLNELDKIFSFSGEPEIKPIAITTPAESYEAMRHIQDQLLSLGIPGQSPEQAFQYAKLVVQELTNLAKHYGFTPPKRVSEKLEAKTPNDNFKYAQSVVGELQFFNSEYSKVSIPGDVLIPNSVKGKTTSSHVIDILQSAVSEIAIIKIAVGDTSPINLPPLEVGRTPTDVYAQIEYAYNILYALEDELAS